MATSAEVIKNLDNWAVNKINAMQLDLVDGIRRDTPVKTGRAQEGTHITKSIKKIGDTGEIRNEVPYIGWLEFGSDTVAPSAMFRNNIQRVSK
jgi:hypothetical protein